MYYIVQEDLKEEIKVNRYREAVAKFKEMIASEPNKKAGVFLIGDSAALHWHFGDYFLTPSKN